jgi:hypothetical protein
VRRIFAYTAGLACAAALMVGGQSAADVTATADATVTVNRPTPVTVSLPVRTMETPGRNGHNGTIVMRVGASAPVRVIVDTGFSGLLLFPGVWDRTPAGVRIGTETGTVRAPNGTRIKGVRGTAKMSFSAINTTEAIPFLYSKTPNAYLRKWTDMGVYGLLGVGTKGGATMVNPFTALPGALGRQWSIHFSRTKGTSGAVVLGSPPPADSRMTFPLNYLGTNSVGSPLWDDQAATGCWAFAGGAEQCVDTWFDAAFTLMRVKGASFADLRTDKRGYLRSGTRVTLAAPGAAFIGHSFAAGSRASRNLVKVISNGDPLINTGNSFYFDYTLYYDLVTGRISLKDKGA